jgi:hypothetical protein
LDEDNQTEMTWHYKGNKVAMPCYWYEGRCIWGLSLMMLGELLDLVEGGNSRQMNWRRLSLRRQLRRRKET